MRKGLNVNVVTIEDDLPHLWADPEHFRWIVNNLAGNGVKHTEQGGQVDLSFGISDEHMVMIVQDTGVGIPMDSIDLIFEKFYQVERGGEARQGSVGLGLAVVREIVEGYGGTISVKSELGKGSTFTVTIPISQLEQVDGEET